MSSAPRHTTRPTAYSEGRFRNHVLILNFDRLNPPRKPAAHLAPHCTSSAASLRSSLQRIPHHFRHILRQIFDCCDTLQRGARVGLPCGVKLSLAVEAAGAREATRGFIACNSLITSSASA